MTISEGFDTYGVVSEVQRLQLEPEIRAILDNFTINVGMVIGDDAKAAREAQMMHLQIAKTTVGGQNNEEDIITLGLVWQYLVSLSYPSVMKHEPDVL